MPFPKNDNQGKAHVMIVSYCDVEIEEAMKKASKAESGLKWMAKQVLDLFRFRNFYDQMVFTPEQC